MAYDTFANYVHTLGFFLIFFISLVGLVFDTQTPFNWIAWVGQCVISAKILLFDATRSVVFFLHQIQIYFHYTELSTERMLLVAFFVFGLGIRAIF